MGDGEARSHSPSHRAEKLQHTSQSCVYDVSHEASVIKAIPES